MHTLVETQRSGLLHPTCGVGREHGAAMKAEETLDEEGAISFATDNPPAPRHGLPISSASDPLPICVPLPPSARREDAKLPARLVLIIILFEIPQLI